MKLTCLFAKKTNNNRSGGFALPTVLIASIIMLTVLLVSVASTVTTRVSIAAQAYDQMAQNAGDAGLAYAKACLEANNGIPLWSDANPLTPSTDCTGTQLSGFTCPTGSIDSRCSVTVNTGATAKVLVVGGGGGGGSDMGGGGGGGGVVYSNSFPIAAVAYSVTVGLGGVGGPAGAGQVRGTNGQNSVFSYITAIGGGGGASNHDGSTNPAGNGGSGGGASGGAQPPSGGSGGSGGYGGGAAGIGVSGQGYSGSFGVWAWYPGGGGGAGGTGSTNPAHGGVGLENSILGTSYYWGGGGGGAAYYGVGGNGGNGGGGGGAVGVTLGGSGLNAGSPGTNGCTGCWANVPGGNAGANTGGGGGGGSHYNATNKGGDGGSGIVVVSYPTGSMTATSSVTPTTSGGNTIHKFITSGTFTVTSTKVNSSPVVSTFSVGLPTLANGKANEVKSVGSTKLLKSSTGSAWRTYSQTSRLTIPTASALQVLVVGGGGGGGTFGGGGGAGGLVYDSAFKYSSVQSFTVTVGNGGAGSSTALVAGINGSNSVFGSITAKGGGGGGSRNNSSPYQSGPGGNGGSGGGASMGDSGVSAAFGVATTGQGNNGGSGYIASYRHGGGGGAGAVGGDGIPAQGGNGGNGIVNPIIGSTAGQNVSGNYYLSGGGGGGIYINGGTVGSGGYGGGGTASGSVNGVAGGAGTANTGGGGGGGALSGTGGQGGSGIVIVSYPTGSIKASGGSVTTSGSNTIHTFTSSSTFKVGKGQRTSCLNILNAGESDGDGKYWIYPIGSAGMEVYCDMTTNGGGWVLAMQITAAQDTTFGYQSSYWTSANTLNNVVPINLSSVNAKYDVFNVFASTDGYILLRSKNSSNYSTLSVPGMTGNTLLNRFTTPTLGGGVSGNSPGTTLTYVSGSQSPQELMGYATPTAMCITNPDKWRINFQNSHAGARLGNDVATNDLTTNDASSWPCYNGEGSNLSYSGVGGTLESGDQWQDSFGSESLNRYRSSSGTGQGSHKGVSIFVR